MIVLHPSFDAAVTTAFFTVSDQLNLGARTTLQMGVEGILTIVDLPDFSKDDIEAIARNFDCPGRVINGAGNLVN